MSDNEDKFEVANYKVSVYGAESMFVEVPLPAWLGEMANNRRMHSSSDARNVIATLTREQFLTKYQYDNERLGEALVVQLDS